MKRLQIFREYEDGFVLVNVRHFMTVGINDLGEFDLTYSPLPEVGHVVKMLEENDLTIGNINSLKYFKKEHWREFMLNRVYALSVTKRNLCWLDADGNEAYPDSRFNCGFHRALLWKRSFEQMASLPTGYTGELCILAVRKGHEGFLSYRHKKSAEKLFEMNGHNGNGTKGEIS